jgi:hypothetical protein
MLKLRLASEPVSNLQPLPLRPIGPGGWLLLPFEKVAHGGLLRFSRIYFLATARRRRLPCGELLLRASPLRSQFPFAEMHRAIKAWPLHPKWKKKDRCKTIAFALGAFFGAV